ncbi:AraC family transcriptional regulator [Amycolatopsis anabasis]|uniref:AraC family transcriptional regulator n=1 Tax=Amycolatopsis anabasis TaxID=1840409 RepID=UPI001C550E9E|nr:helix-turn-helix domain-containing protein [Amycolatopsis anabasis]
MAASPTPPQHVLFETTDHEWAGEYLTGVYGGKFRLGMGKKGAPVRFSRLVTDTFAFITATHVADIGYILESVPMLMVARPRTTPVDYRYGGAEYRFGPGEVHLSNTTEDHPPIQARWHNGAVQAVTFPFPLLDQVAAPAETRRPGPVRFTDVCTTTRDGAHQLIATIDYLATSLRDRPETMNEPLVKGAVARLLAAATLTAFPNTALVDPTIEDRHDAHPATLRRAIAFIDDHAHLDISTADIAAAAHVSIRALPYAFRRHRGTTPTGYLRQARLQHAHQDLLAADPTTRVTVTEIAARWGFFHPGRFAHYYRTAYGRPPCQTLRRDT